MGFLDSTKQILGDFKGPSIPGMGMIRDKGIVGTAQAGMSALGNTIDQGVHAAGNFGGKILYGNHPPAPTPVAAPVVKQAAPAVNPPMGMNRVDLGGGSSITAQRPIQPAMAQNMQAAAVPSTPEASALRAESAAMADQRYADLRAQQAPQQVAPQVGGMMRPAAPDYSGVIDQAVGDIQSGVHGSGFDAALAHKHKVAAAQDLLKSVGGIQGNADQNANQMAIADMNNQSAQMIAQGNQAAQAGIAQQRNAMDMGELASQDQYRTNQSQIASGRLGMDKQVAEAEAARLAAARNTYADQLKAQGTGMFFNNDELLNQAELVRSGAISPDAMFKQNTK